MTDFHPQSPDANPDVNMARKKSSASCPSCGKLFHCGKVHTASERLKDHMRETGHNSCNDSNCPICGKQFHSGGYHPADQKLYHHMYGKDECHRQRARRMNWKKRSWSHDVPRKLWFQH